MLRKQYELKKKQKNTVKFAEMFQGLNVKKFSRINVFNNRAKGVEFVIQIE